MAEGQSLVARYLCRIAARLDDGSVPDAEFLARFVFRRDPAAFEMLVWRHHRMVLGVCGRLLTDPTDIEDAFQATFLALLEKAGTIRKREALGSWLYKVAYRVALRARVEAARRGRHERQGLGLAAAAADRQGPPEGHGELWPLLDSALHDLPEKYRVPLVLCYLEGKTYEEAARQLGCPKGTVSIRMTRAREMLRRQFARRGLSLPTALLVGALAEAASPAAFAAHLVRGTVAAAAAYGAGREAAGAVSARVIGLAKGGTNIMLPASGKVAAKLLLLPLMAGALAACAAALGGRPGTGDPLGESGRAAPAQAGGAEGPGAAPTPLPRPTYWKSLEAGGIVHDLRWGPDGKTVSCEIKLPGPRPGTGGDSEIRAWDTASGKRVEPPPLSRGVTSPDGKLVAAVGEGRTPAGRLIWVITVRDAAKATPRATIEGESVFTHDLFGYQFSPDGKTLATSQQAGQVTLWDPLTGKKTRKLEGHDRTVFGLAFSPDGKVLATASVDKTIRLWDVETGQLRDTLEEHTGEVRAVAYLPGGKTFVSISGDGTARLWDAATGKPLRVLAGHESGIQTFALSPDARTLATGTEGVEGKNGKVRLWDLRTGKVLAVLERHTKNIATLAFSADGKALASGGGDGTIQLWRMR